MLPFSSKVVMVYFAKLKHPSWTAVPSVLRASRDKVVLITECVYEKEAAFEGFIHDCLRERPKKEQKETKERIFIGISILF